MCSMGKTTCDGTTWGACVGDQVTTHAFSGGGLHLSNLGTSTSCGSSNPCDPYCQVVVDNPNGLDAGGGLIGTDGGLVIPGADSGAQSDGGAAGGGSYYSQPNGINTCNPNRNVGPGNSCTVGGNEYTQCQQDFHCDGSSGTCAYNGGSGWVDLRCNGVDLTVAAPCDNSGTAYFPICNRGLGTVPASTPLTIYYTNPPNAPDGCSTVSGPAQCTVTVGASGLGPGQCMDAVGCGPPGDKFVVINAGQTNLTECTTPAGPACKNNAAYGKTAGAQCSQCAARCSTTVSGTVYDPGENVPLPGVTVFQPSGALTTLPNGVACDTCASVSSPLKSASFSGVDGKFVLPVTPGTNVPIVFQSGRWRRKIVLPTVTACQDNPIANSGATETRLPRNASEGDLPLTAIVTGTHEAVECLIAKVGVSTSEIDRPAAGKRFQIYKDTGADTSPAAPAMTSLWNSQAAMNGYSTILLPCSGGSEPVLSATQQSYFQAWGDAGGRLFANHKSGIYTAQSTGGNGFSPWNTTSTWQSEATPTAPAKGKILGNDAVHTTFRNWMTGVGAYGGGEVSTPDPYKQALDPVVAKGGFDWVRGESSNNWSGDPNGNYELSFSFDTPVNSANKCGRVLFNGMHVDATRGTASGTFPNECSLGPGLTPNELMFEYLLFQLTSCAVGSGFVPAPPTPPPPPPLPVTTFTRDYHATCQPQTCVQWEFFAWQAQIPTNTSIDFTAQTSTAAADGTPVSYGPAVPVGSATSTTSTWTSDACTVDGHLQNLAATAKPPQPACVGVNPPQHSEEWLRVNMTFNPSGQSSPALTTWRQMYDCIPCE
jgi:hypothetical protein